MDVLIQMDADFSHRPEDLPSLLGTLQNFDFVVGSRYVREGKWAETSHRTLLNRLGSLYSKSMLGIPIFDLTGGFNAWKRKVVEQMDLDTLAAHGYAFQIEVKYRAWKKNFRGTECPVIFEKRKEGTSKLNKAIIYEALLMVWKLRCSYIQ